MLIEALYCVSVSKLPSPTMIGMVVDAVNGTVKFPTVTLALEIVLLEYGYVLPP